MGAVKDGRSYGCSATAAIIFAQLFGIAAITLMLVWLLHFREGVALSSTVEIRLLNVSKHIYIYKTIYLITNYHTLILLLLIRYITFLCSLDLFTLEDKVTSINY